MKQSIGLKLGSLAFLVCAACVAAQSGNNPPPAAGAPESTSPAPGEPDINTMLVAHRPDKPGAPVDVRYQFSATPVLDQPATLHIAIVPRVAAQNMHVEFPPPHSVTVDAGGTALVQQKADAQGIYRRKLTITPHADSGEVRVLVAVDVAGGRYFTIFTIPVSASR